MSNVHHSRSRAASSKASALVLVVAACLAFRSVALGQLDHLLAPIESDVKLASKVATTPDVAAAAQSPEQATVVSFLTADDLVMYLTKQLKDHFAVTGDLSLSLSRPWTKIKLPDGDIAVTVTEYPDRMTSSFLVRCKAVSAGQVLGEWQIGLRAQLWQEVWVASARLDRGEALDRSLVNAQKIDVLRDQDPHVGTDVDPAEYEVAQSVGAGRPLSKHDIIERPLIRKNQIVEVVANQGAIGISMKAQALQNGAANALIKMRNLDSHREFTAQVINETRVQVQF